MASWGSKRTSLCASGLLPARDVAQAAGSPRAGTDVAGRAGDIVGHPDARRASAPGRRTGVGAAALHATGARTAAGLGEVGLGITDATAAAYPRGTRVGGHKSQKDEVK